MFWKWNFHQISSLKLQLIIIRFNIDKSMTTITQIFQIISKNIFLRLINFLIVFTVYMNILICYSQIWHSENVSFSFSVAYFCHTLYIQYNATLIMQYTISIVSMCRLFISSATVQVIIKLIAVYLTLASILPISIPELFLPFSIIHVGISFLSISFN